MMNYVSKSIFMIATTIAIAIVGLLLVWSQIASAAPNLHINYQGKLTDATGTAVPDGDYNLRFWLYDTAGAATTSAIWHESLGNASSTAVTITNGLFSVMLGSTSPLTSVDFNQTLYLGVEIGSSTPTPTWDGEMSPRKTLGTVPAAFEARQLDGLATTSFLRSDQADTMEATESSTLLSLIQNGTGAIFDAVNASTASVFKIFESGVVTIGTSTETGIATSTGLAIYNKDVEVILNDATFLASTSISKAVYDLEVVDDYAYLALGSGTGDEFEIWDISDRLNVSKVSGLPLDDSASGIAIAGNYAYVVTRTNGNDLDIIDISDKSNPSYVGAADLGASEVNDVVVQGSRAYIGSYSNFIYVYDISDPTTPVELGSADVGGDVLKIKVVGNYAYLAAALASQNFQVWDISDPSNMFVVGSSTTSNTNVLSLDVSGSIAVTGTQGGADPLEVWDISDPTNPTSLDSIGFYENFAEVEIVGDYVFAARIFSGSGSVDIYDISNPTAIVELFQYDIAAVQDLEVSDNTIFAVTDDTTDTFLVFDLPGFMTPTANIGNLVSNDIESDYVRVTQSLVTDGSLNVGTNAMIGGSLTITGTASSSLQAANTNPALTITSGYVGIGTTTPYADLSVAGDVALTGGLYDSTASLGTSEYMLQSTGSGLQWIDAASLGIASGGGSSLFTDGGDITYLTSLTDVLAIGTSTDIATSTGLAVYNRDIELFQGTPELVGSVSTVSDSVEGLVVAGDYAYTVGWTTTADEFEIIDISDPVSPSVVGGYNVGDNMFSLVVAGNYAYLGSGTSGDEFEIIDISDPTNPVKVGGLGGLKAVFDIDVAGNYAYAAGGNYTTDGDIYIIDISDPTNPYVAGTADPASHAFTIESQGNYVYVGSGITGDDIEIFDASDPKNVSKVGGVGAPESVMDMVVFGKYVYAVTNWGTPRLVIVDVSDPSSPSTITSSISFPAAALSIEKVANYLFIGIGSSGDDIFIYDITDPSSPQLVDSWEAGSEIYGLQVQGGYLYAGTYVSGEGLQVYDLPSLVTPTASIGNLLSNDIETAYLTVTQALKADSLNINTNGMIGGSLTITGTASSSLIASNTNTALTITSGYIQMGTSTNATSGIQIGYGAICVDNDGACTASTTGRISSVSTYSGNSDLAETYFSSQPLEAGDIVALDGELSVQQANKANPNTIIGVVSTKPGVLLGFDDISTRAGETAYPIALKGRIPVKVSTENGPINPGDQLMLSSIPGTAMKATGTGATIGIALEAFNPTDNDQYYSDTFINQYIDDLPSTEDATTITEQLKASTTNRIALGTTTRDRADDTEVQQGQIVMFVDLGYRYLDESTEDNLATLMDSESDDVEESLFSRMLKLARGFIDGALSIFAIEANRVEVVDELCINGTCIQSDDLRVLIHSLDEGVTQVTIIEDDGPAEDDISVDMDSDSDEIVTTQVSTSTTPQTPATTTESGENTTTASTTVSDNSTTASTTTAGGDLVNTQTASSSENTEVEPQNDDVQQTEVGETPVADEDPQADETPVSDEVETDTAPVPEEPEPEVVEEVEVPEPVNQATS